MKLHTTTAAGQNLVTGYGPGHVTVNGEEHRRNLLVSPTRIDDWPVAGFETLCVADFAAIAAACTP